jgi:hypothetical protein
MSILDVTEDQIFHTLGRGRDPNFKPIEKVRPVLERPKKTYPISKTIRSANPAFKNMQSQPVQAAVEPITSAAPQVDDSLKKLTEDLNELNNRVAGIQKMVKWYVVPQFVVVLALVLALIVKS